MSAKVTLSTSLYGQVTFESNAQGITAIRNVFNLVERLDMLIKIERKNNMDAAIVLMELADDYEHGALPYCPKCRHTRDEQGKARHDKQCSLFLTMLRWSCERCGDPVEKPANEADRACSEHNLCSPCDRVHEEELQDQGEEVWDDYIEAGAY